MKHLLKKHRMLSVGIFLAAVLSIIYAAILSPLPEKVPVLFLNFVPRFFAKR